MALQSFEQIIPKFRREPSLRHENFTRKVGLTKQAKFKAHSSPIFFLNGDFVNPLSETLSEPWNVKLFLNDVTNLLHPL